MEPTAENAPGSDTVRGWFPRMEEETYLNAAAATPLGAPTKAGIEAFEEYWTRGPGDGRGDDFGERLTRVRKSFARLVGARDEEIAFVQCTKAGEQIVLDGVEALRRGGNLVTNDLHFTGSLHNLEGLRRAGVDVRIVRSREFDLDVRAMAEAIDERTALVCVSHPSNVHGRLERLPELCELAHRHGALVYADIIQSAGATPLDLRALGVDFAACSAYKWLLATHGIGFLYVRAEHQGNALADRMFPGHVRHQYAPWTTKPAAAKPSAQVPVAERFSYRPPSDASRYQPGHPSYIGLYALSESLPLLEMIGVERVHAHSVALNARLLDGLDRERFTCISPRPGESTIVTLQVVGDPAPVRARLERARITVSFSGRRIRVSPALYNQDRDVDRLLEVLHGPT